MSSFEDGVIFVHDVEQALEQIDAFSQQLIATIVFQEYTQDEAAAVLRCARRTVCREFPAARDRMTGALLVFPQIHFMGASHELSWRKSGVG